MDNIKDSEFDQIRPFYDSEVHDAIERIVVEKGFRKTLEYFFPNAPIDQTIQMLKSITTVRDFQEKFICVLVQAITKKYITKFSFSGIENVPEDKGYILISNHRDIILDSALLNTHFALNGRSTSEIAIGSNLLILPWITDLVKLNRTFVVRRNIPVKEQYECSLNLSKYIRHTILDKKTSIWIAQREGRTKNGDDKTQASVLKMFNMSVSGDVLENLSQLNIVPMTISYEYDPVDIYKVIEKYNKLVDSNFKKSKLDDMAGMRNGITCNKGRVHINLGKPINNEILNLPKAPNKNIQYEEVAKFIDSKIYSGYQLYPINFVSADILCGDNKYSDRYTQEDKTQVLEYIEKQSLNFKGDVELQRKMLMEIYANPVFNSFGK
ncbi:MAG: 1-acyl-sn-glycerol-3-phosphate acyltransferase [Bacteroidales bacterium]|nr:1-acyl-sn-glycerol-3-phosphate acyltransferase [Bacteroidales bacterium]